MELVCLLQQADRWCEARAGPGTYLSLVHAVLVIGMIEMFTPPKPVTVLIYSHVSLYIIIFRMVNSSIDEVTRAHLVSHNIV